MFIKGAGMKTSTLEQNGISEVVKSLVVRLVDMIEWPDRRRAMGDVALSLLNGKSRVAESEFGWNRNAVELGINEHRTGFLCVNDLSNRRKPKTEEKNPQLLVAIKNIMDPESQAEARLQTDLAYTHLTASAVRAALKQSELPDEAIPTLRTLSNILNRQKYRLRRVVKDQVQKKTNSPAQSSKT
jgi:hypothetical protein